MSLSSRTNARDGSSRVAAVLSWAWVGLGAGSVVAALTVAANDSLRTVRDTLVFSLWVAVVYAAGFVLLGTVVAVLAGRAPTRRRDAHLIAAWTFFALAALLNAALTWWGPSNAVHGALLAAGALLLLLGAVVYVRRAAASWGRTLRLAVLSVPLLVPPLVACAWTLSRGATAVVASPLRAQRDPLRTLVVGVDGADWQHLDPLIAAGRMPTFERLIRGGVRGPLRTITPTYSPIIWTTILTGRDETAHGVRDFSELHLPGVSAGIQRLLKAPRLSPPGVGLRELVHFLTLSGIAELTPITAQARRVKSIWNVASEAGLRVGVINWFATWPAESVNGFIVSDRNRIAFRDGRASASEDGDRRTFPPELMARLEDTYAADHRGGTPDFFPPSGPPPTRRDRDYFAAVHGADLFALNAARTLLREEQLPFLAVYVAGVDVCSHYFLRRYPALIDRYYELVDGELARLLALVPPDTTVMVLSDHGWGTDQKPPFGHDHAPDGIILATGPGVTAGTRFTRAPSIFDVAPTIAALLGLPRSQEMTGQALAEVIPDAAYASLPAPVASYGAYVPPPAVGRGARHDAVAQDTVERLRALGYVQ